MKRSIVSLATIAGLAVLLAGLDGRAIAGDLAQGEALYMRYCAACHGKKADGRGPAARSFKQQPADLTKLGERYGTPLPVGQIARFIDGRDYVAAHGERDMPVWGKRFADLSAAKGNMDEMIKKIIAYLNSIQRPSQPTEPPPKPLSDRR